tara:strand:- start:973 stop:1077 length:105 start_codon:yes stop_codon:yes gene_type:complete
MFAVLLVVVEVARKNRAQHSESVERVLEWPLLLT